MGEVARRERWIYIIKDNRLFVDWPPKFIVEMGRIKLYGVCVVCAPSTEHRPTVHRAMFRREIYSGCMEGDTGTSDGVATSSLEGNRGISEGKLFTRRTEHIDLRKPTDRGAIRVGT